MAALSLLAFRRARKMLEDSKKKAERDARPFLFQLVAPTGFEPAISALRGRRPKPLDDGAMLWLGWKESNPHIRYQKPLSYH